MRILLVAPSFENPKYPLYLPSENLGLGYLASLLRIKGVEAEILDANMRELPAESVPAYAKNSCYDIVGISVPFQSAIDESLKIARIARLAWPNTHITVGGHFPTFRHQEILKHTKEVDSVVRGDGEDVILSLCEALPANRGLDSVAGLTFRDSVGRIVVNLARPPREDLDSLPWPARDTLGFIRDLGHLWPTQISSSRGCYASCAFCDIRSFYGRSWRARNPVPLVDEIEWLHRTYGSITFRFTDDEFIGPRPGRGLHGPTRARHIAQEIIRRNLRVKLMIDSRPEAVNRDLFLELREAGTIDCLVGIESGVDRILRLYNKGATVAQNIRAIEILRELGIELNLGFIMFDPRMTMEELKQNVAFLRSMEILTVDSIRSWLWPLLGTPAVDQIRTAGLVEAESLGEISYRFMDASVQEVYNIICECANRSQPLDRAIFRLRKDTSISRSTLACLLGENLHLWTRILDSALEHHRGFDFAWVNAEIDRMLQRLATSTSTQNETFKD